ncbi:MAG: hypothetical protein II180_08765 [Proteobacteria bacterium]|nr:hypothetical protein [Pseudomonadota bacterium]
MTHRFSSLTISLCTTAFALVQIPCAFADGDSLDKSRWNDIEVTDSDKPATAEIDKKRWNDISTDDSEDSNSRDLSFHEDEQSKAASKEEEAEIPGDPHRGSRTWQSPDPTAQLERDAQLQPVLKGGIFVPAMSQGLNEPKYIVRDKDDKIIAESHTGATAYVSTGDYKVTVGSPVAGERPEFAVHVVEGAITTVPVEWSGLIVKVVNDRASMIRGNYEIVSLPDRGYIGLGSGALVNEGERLSTWLLWPGQYMIISAGEGYQARKNFITVKLSPGELSRVTLVLDEETGNILGGGEIEDLLEITEERWWWAGVLVGGSVRFNRTDNVVGKVTGQLLDISAFLEAYYTLNRKKHFFYTRLNAEIGGTIRFEDRPFVTTVDDLNLELLYSYRLIDWFGPYARFSFESNMAPTWQELSGNYTVIVQNSSGTIITENEERTDIKLSPAFSPIKLNTGIGGRFDYTYGSWFKIAARLGLAYRYTNARDLFIVTDTNDSEKAVTLKQVFSSSQFGFEAATTLDLTPIQWFTLKLDASVIEPFNAWQNPIFDLKLDAAIRLSSIASLSYTLRLNYDISMIDKLQIDQYIQLRFSYKIY